MPSRIISHRGLCRKHAWLPRKGENTLEAFEEGVHILEAMGQKKAIELDVRRAKDGVLVVRHHERLEVTTNCVGNVWDYTSTELKAFNAGYGRKIPLLTEVLDRFKNEDVELTIELKENGIIHDVKRLVLERGLEKRVVIAAFDKDDNDRRYRFPERFSNWEELPHAGPELRFAFLATKKKVKSMGAPALTEYAKTHGAFALHVHAGAVTKSMVQLAHFAGLGLRAYTVNRKREFKRLAAMGVDAVFCDNPKFLHDKTHA